jgi:sugar lactone lactonase YvrE
MAARRVRPIFVLFVLLAALAAAAAVAAAPASALTSADYAFVSSIGPNYGLSLAFSGSVSPAGCAVDAMGNVYTTLPAGFAKFDANGTYVCTYTGDNGVPGDNGAIVGSYGLDVAPNGMVIVADMSGNKVVTVAPKSGGLAAAEYTEVASIGGPAGQSGDGQFNSPSDVAIDGDAVYVADRFNDRIQQLHLDSATGALTYVAKFGAAGSAPGQFDGPYCVAADGLGHLFVSEVGNRRVQEMTTAGTAPSVLTVTGPADNEMYVNIPVGVDVDAAGDVYVADMGSNWVDKFRATAGVWHQVTRFGSIGPDSGQFQSPFALAAAGNGYLYVADSGNHQIKRLARDLTAPAVEGVDVPLAWVNHDVSVSLRATDSAPTGQYASGVDDIEYTLTGGAPWTLYAAPIAVGAEGDNALTCRATDAVGNVSAPVVVHVKIDKTPPVSSASGVPAGWGNAVIVKLGGTDGGLSGLTSTEYRRQGEAAWTPYTGVFTPAQGVTVYEFRSADVAGNVESPKSVTVRYDTGRPVPKALANVAVKRGRTVKLGYRVTDVTPQATVIIKVYKGTKLKATLKLGKKATGLNLTHSWRCTLAAGKYSWKVYATDLAGNTQAKPALRTLVVK